MGTTRRTWLLTLLVCLAGDPIPSAADELVPRKGKRVRGRIVKQSDAEVVLNIYNSANPGVTNPDHLVRIPRSGVKEVIVERPAEVAFYERLEALATDDARGYVELAKFAKSKKLKRHVRIAAAYALRADGTNKEALKLIGGASKWKQVQARRPAFSPELAGLLQRYLETDDPEARILLAADLKKRGTGLTAEMLERTRASAGEAKGLRLNEPVSWGAPEHPDAVMTLFVPAGYTPIRTWPLLIGLHGGGPGGKDGDEVVGSGPSAMNFYRREAAKRGYIVVCPTALTASWGRPHNEQLVRDVLTELCWRFAIDLDRVYMTGHSMGGYGTWSLGPRMAAELAAISPMAGQGRGGIQELVATRTPIFIYHSDNDYIDVSTDRAAAKQLRQSDLDFVYTELPGKGHGYPDSIQIELFEFLGPRRRYDKKQKDLLPRHALWRKGSPDEARYLGAPLDHLSQDPVPLKRRMAHFALGGGCARRAAAALQRDRPEGVASAVAKLLRTVKAPPSARAEAARLLGALADVASARPALERAVGIAPARTESAVVQAAARALAQLQVTEGRVRLEKALTAWTVFYESKLVSERVHFSDSARVIPVLTTLADALGRLAPGPTSVKVIERQIMAKVLRPAHTVRTSERVPQDPSRMREALAAAAQAVLEAADAPPETLAALRADASKPQPVTTK